MNPELCIFLENGGNVSCFLSDSIGRPVNPLGQSGITCTILNDRENVDVTLPNNQEVTLQKVTIKKTGYVVIQVTNGLETCTSDPIPFFSVESALLCAPEGTDIVCNVRDFNCDACINCRDGIFQSVEIFLDICLDIQVVTDTVIGIQANYCNPREQLFLERCRDRAIPPACNLSSDATKNAPEALPPTKPSTDLQNRIEPAQTETICTKVEKVYDWITQQSNIEVRKNADDATFNCNVLCTLNLFVPAITVCERTLFGNLECNGERVTDALIDFSTSIDVVSFSPDPTITDANGNFTTVITVDEGTEPIPIEITASTNVNGTDTSTTLPTIARCLADPCLLTLFGPETVDCNGIVDGRVRCDNTFIPDVEVTLTANPAIVTFNPTPAITGTNGNYFSGISVPNGTPPTDVEITATATVNGQPLTETIIINVSCASDCALTIAADPLITCDGEVTGVLTCGGLPVDGALVEFSNFPSVGSFTPIQATTQPDGSFTTTLIIPEGTPILSTAITASTIVNGQNVSASIGIQVECPTIDECPCKFRMGVAGGAAPASIDITTGGMSTTLQGTINVTAVQCFVAAPFCNPASNNFNVSFDSDGGTINFLAGRRIEIACDGNTFAYVRGTARAQGNILPAGIYEVTITRGISGGLAVWTVDATDFAGNTFSTSFTANINPITFIGDCTDVP